jgi:hypothetical protein
MLNHKTEKKEWEKRGKNTAVDPLYIKCIFKSPNSIPLIEKQYFIKLVIQVIRSPKLEILL